MKLASEKGQAITELGLILPFLILLLLPTIDFGRFFYFGQALTHAVRAGAQYGLTQDILGANATDFATIADNIKAAVVDAGTDIPLATANVTTADRYWRCGADATSTHNTTFPIPADSCTGDTVLVYVQVVVTRTLDTMFSYPWMSTSWPLTKSAEIRVQ
jgi:Flp pilus assembly protein TadG